MANGGKHGEAIQLEVERAAASEVAFLCLLITQFFHRPTPLLAFKANPAPAAALDNEAPSIDRNPALVASAELFPNGVAGRLRDLWDRTSHDCLHWFRWY